MHCLLATTIASIAASIFMMMELPEAVACDRTFVVQNLTSFGLRDMSMEGRGLIHAGSVDTTNTGPWKMTLHGSGSATFIARLSGGQTLTREILDFCAASQIIIDRKDGKLRMIVN
jgi:hypothetical protein